MATYNNGLQFDVSGNLLVTFAGGAAGGAVISAGTNSQNTGTVVFSNSNGVTFGLNTNGVLTATVTPGAAAGIGALQVSNTTYTSGTVVFSNSNGISFGSTAGGGVTASYTVPGATVFSNSNNVSFGLAGSTVTASASYSQPSATVFSNSNNVSFGLAGSTITATATFAGGGSPNVSAGTTSNNLGSIVFSNSNGVSFGLNGSTITASASGAGASASVFALGNTTGQSSSNTVALSALNFSFSGVVSGGLSGNTLIISSPGTTNFANLSVSAGTTSGSLGSIVFSNSNGVSFGLNGSTITASAAAGGSGVAQAAGTQTATSGTVIFSNSNGITFGMSNSSVVTASYTVPGATVFSNSNNVSFGLAGSTVTATATFAQTNQSIGLYALGNTTQNSSTTLDARTLSFNALGAMTMGYTNGTIQVSAPATSSISGTGAVSVQVNGSTISIGAPAQTLLSFFNAIPPGITQVAQNGQGSVQVYPVYDPEQFSCSRADIMASISVSSSSNSSHAGVISAYIGLYTRNVSTLSLASSGSQSYQWTNTSNNSMASISAFRRLSVPINVNYSGGDIWVGVMSLTSTTNANWFTASNLVVQPLANVQLQGLIGEASNNTKQYILGQGVFSATSNAMPSSMAFTQITGVGSSGIGANMMLAPIMFANLTV